MSWKVTQQDETENYDIVRCAEDKIIRNHGVIRKIRMEDEKIIDLNRRPRNYDDEKQ